MTTFVCPDLPKITVRRRKDRDPAAPMDDDNVPRLHGRIRQHKEALKMVFADLAAARGMEAVRDAWPYSVMILEHQ